MPYRFPFLFVDTILSVTEDSVVGEYQFVANLPFYDGHFIDNPITPGVILTECCAQIGVVCLGIFLKGEENAKENIAIGLSSSKMDFYIPILPGEKVRVESKKQYFRFGKLMCHCKMYNSENKLVCRGEIAGMIKQQ